MRQALDEAARSGRNVLVKFGAAWCGPCQKMKRETMTDRQVISTLNDCLIPVEVDVDRDRQAAGQFQIDSVPTVLILSPEGRVLRRQTGFMSPAQLLNMVEPFCQTQSRPQSERPAQFTRPTRTTRNFRI